jgi:magnesium chelatase family protein
MSLAVIHSRAQDGVDAPPVTVEVHLANGLPALSIVGLAETAVRESKDRVRGALLNARFEFPARRITINLAPADLPKEGGCFDLPIALGILAASGQLPLEPLQDYEFLGELALTGALRRVRTVLPAALALRGSGRRLVVPRVNGDEAALVRGVEVLCADHLLDVTGHFNDGAALGPPPLREPQVVPAAPDLADVRGQLQARRALEVAAAGGHSLLMVGPPGTGKTMLASRLPGILPPLGEQEALEVAAVHALASAGFDPQHWRRRPFRAPHHTASAVALVGGGGYPRPGEISLAHHGVLFLDELPEFDRRVLEVLREPLESGQVTISRAARQARFPARFQLLAAMNPCPCGYLGDPAGRCHCSWEQVRRYRARISGPLLDRIDLHVEVAPVPHEWLHLGDDIVTEGSAPVRERVLAARSRQRERANLLNCALDNTDIDRYCRPSTAARQLLDAAMQRLALSARAYHRVLRVARSIADLAGVQQIEDMHVAEAVQLRCLDRRPQNGAG